MQAVDLSQLHSRLMSLGNTPEDDDEAGLEAAGLITEAAFSIVQLEDEDPEGACDASEHLLQCILSCCLGHGGPHNLQALLASNVLQLVTGLAGLAGVSPKVASQALPSLLTWVFNSPTGLRPREAIMAVNEALVRHSPGCADSPQHLFLLWLSSQLTSLLSRVTRQPLPTTLDCLHPMLALIAELCSTFQRRITTAHAMASVAAGQPSKQRLHMPAALELQSHVWEVLGEQLMQHMAQLSDSCWKLLSQAHTLSSLTPGQQAVWGQLQQLCAACLQTLAHAYPPCCVLPPASQLPSSVNPAVQAQVQAQLQPCPAAIRHVAGTARQVLHRLAAADMATQPRNAQPDAGTQGPLGWAQMYQAAAACGRHIASRATDHSGDDDDDDDGDDGGEEAVGGEPGTQQHTTHDLNSHEAAIACRAGAGVLLLLDCSSSDGSGSPQSDCLGVHLSDTREEAMAAVCLCVSAQLAHAGAVNSQLSLVTAMHTLLVASKVAAGLPDHATATSTCAGTQPHDGGGVAARRTPQIDTALAASQGVISSWVESVRSNMQMTAEQFECVLSVLRAVAVNVIHSSDEGMRSLAFSTFSQALSGLPSTARAVGLVTLLAEPSQQLVTLLLQRIRREVSSAASAAFPSGSHHQLNNVSPSTSPLVHPVLLALVLQQLWTAAAGVQSEGSTGHQATAVDQLLDRLVKQHLPADVASAFDVMSAALSLLRLVLLQRATRGGLWPWGEPSTSTSRDSTAAEHTGNHINTQLAGLQCLIAALGEQLEQQLCGWATELEAAHTGEAAGVPEWPHSSPAVAPGAVGPLPDSVLLITSGSRLLEVVSAVMDLLDEWQTVPAAVG